MLTAEAATAAEYAALLDNAVVFLLARHDRDWLVEQIESKKTYLAWLRRDLKWAEDSKHIGSPELDGSILVHFSRCFYTACKNCYRLSKEHPAAVDALRLATELPASLFSPLSFPSYLDAVFNACETRIAAYLPEGCVDRFLQVCAPKADILDESATHFSVERIQTEWLTICRAYLFWSEPSYLAKLTGPLSFDGFVDNAKLSVLKEGQRAAGEVHPAFSKRSEQGAGFGKRSAETILIIKLFQEGLNYNALNQRTGKSVHALRQTVRRARQDGLLPPAGESPES